MYVNWAWFPTINGYDGNPKSSTPLPTWLIIWYRSAWNQGTSLMYYWLDGRLCDGHRDGVLSNNPWGKYVLAAKVPEFPLAIPAWETLEMHVNWFGGLGKNLLLMRPSYVLLSVWMRVCGCGWYSYLKVLRMGTTVLAFKNNAPIYASAADEMTLRMIVDRLRTEQLFGGFYLQLDRKLWPPARLSTSLLES